MYSQIFTLILLGIFPWATQSFPSLPLEEENEFEIVQPIDLDFIMDNIDYFNDTEAPDPEAMENDIVFSPESDDLKAATVKKNRLWKNGFYVQLDKAFTAKEEKTIQAAIRELRSMLSCVNITIWNKNAKPRGDYVYMKRNRYGGCNSWVGRVGGKQILNLQYSKCIRRSDLLHELIHAIGFWHEQSRSDRNKYVTVHLQNVKNGMAYNYNTHKNAQLLTPYDQQSVMHYGEKWFTKNGRKTLSSKTGEPLGWQGDPTEYDVQKIRILYGCEL